MKYTIFTTGCDKNKVLSQKLKSNLAIGGGTYTDSADEADVIYVNTCSFINAARDESINAIEKACKYPKAKIIVLGCYAQMAADELRAKFPNIEVYGCRSYERSLNSFKQSQVGVRAYLTIADGCNRSCAYCSIPKIKGPYTSRPINDIITEAQDLVARGVKEITLVAQETTLYGIDLYGKCRLLDLIHMLSNIKGLYRIRISYMYPDMLTDALINEIQNNNKVAKFFDIAMQHASTSVLNKMGRKTSREDLERLMKQIREKVPNAFIKNTFLLGFPKETDEDIQILSDFCTQYPSENTGLFLYSKEAGTPAAKMKQIPPRVVDERFEQISSLARPIGRDLLHNRIGSTAKIIIDHYDDERDRYIGWSDYDVEYIGNYTTVFSAKELHAGDVINATIIGTSDSNLVCSYDGGDWIGSDD